MTVDETSVYDYDVETKVQSSQWMRKFLPLSKKACQSHSDLKVMLLVFFYWMGTVHYEFVQPGETVDKEFYLNVLKRLRETGRGLRRGQTPPGYCTMTVHLFMHHSLSVNF